jgi:hypothetical protein
MISNRIGYLYLILKENTNTYKIGITKKNPNLRLKSLQTGNESILVLYYFIKSKCYTNLEVALHNEFKLNRKNGEWFEFDNIDEVKERIDLINSQLEFLLESYHIA